MASKRKRPASKPSKPEKRAKPKGLTKNQIRSLKGWETRRSVAAATALLERKRSERAVKGWATRRKREAGYRELERLREVREAERIAEEVSIVQLGPREEREPREPTVEEMTAVRKLGFVLVPEHLQEGFSEMAKVMSQYGDTADRDKYDRFREWKRTLYDHYSPDFAHILAVEAAIEAGWDEEHAERFAKLS